MRKFLIAAIPAALLVSGAALAQTTAPREPMGTGRYASPDTNTRDDWAVTPSQALIGKTIVMRRSGEAIGTIRDIADGMDGRQKLIVDLRGQSKRVALDFADVERRGQSIQLMIDREQLAMFPEHSATAAGSSGSPTGQ